MRRWIKRLLLAAGASLALLAALAVALRLAFPPQRLKALALARIGQALGREARLQSVRLGLGAVELRGFELSQEPDFKAGVFLKAGALRARPALRSLLRGRLELGSVSIENWECRLAPASGRPPGPGREPAAASPAAPAGGAASRLSIGRLESRRGTLRYEDGAGTALLLTQIAARLDDPRPRDPFPARLSLAYSGRASGRPIQGNLDFSGRVDAAGPDLARAVVNIASLKLQHKEPSFPELSLSASGELRGKELELREAELRAGGLRASARGRLSFAKQSLYLELRARDLPLAELARLLPTAAPFALDGSASLEARASGPFSSPRWSAEISFRGLRATVSGQRLSRAEGSASLGPDRLSAKARGLLGKGELQLSLSAKDYRRAPRLQLEGSLSELDLAAWSGAQASASKAQQGPRAGKSAAAGSASAASPPWRAAGNFTVGRIVHPQFEASKASLSWDLSSPGGWEKLDGKAKLRVGPGRFDDLAALGAGKPLLRAALTPLLALQKAAGLLKIPLFPAFDRVRFQEITGDYAFKRGVMTVKECHMDSSAAYVRITGSADLPGDRLDLRVSTKLGAQTGLKLSGPLGFTVKGPLASPVVRADAASLLKQPGVEDALEQGRKLLQGIFQ